MLVKVSKKLREHTVVRIFVISMLLLGSLRGFVQASEVSQEMLNLPITLLSGQTVTLSQFKGKKPVYLKFWATWCQPCRKEMPHLQHTFEKYGNKVQVIAINLGVNDDLQSVKAMQREFGLSMPMTIDKTGQLSKAFNLIGTPYHVLLDKYANVIHKGHEAATELDEKIKLVAADKPVTSTEAPLEVVSGAPVNLDGISGQTTALFFVSTWCDWYLKDSRPSISENCVRAQNEVNNLYAKYPQINWIGVASRLWTGEAELAEYKKKFNIQHPLTIDTTNNVFFNYGVKNFPTLILMNKGKEVLRTQRIDSKELSAKLRQFDHSLK